MTGDAFEEAARTHGDMLYRVALHAVGNRPDAEDVVQTALLRLYEYAGEFESGEHLKRWLLRVAVNESRKLLRAFWRRRVVALDEEWDAAAPEADESREVLRAVMALEPKYRVAVYLYYYEGCSVKETAALMRAKESTVQTWLARAREKLRAALADEKEETEYASP